MRKLAFLGVAFALVAVSFYGCDETNLAEPERDPSEASLRKVSRGHATLLSTEGVPMAFIGGTGTPRGVNGRGQVVGWYWDNSHAHAVVWEDGMRKALPELGGNYSLAKAINNRGQIVGGSRDADGIMYAVLWENGSILKLGPSDISSYAWDINDKGQICGELDGLPVMWENGQLVDLGFSGLCYAINNRGQLAGDGREGGTHAVLWEKSIIAHLAPWWSRGHDINEKGQVLIEAEPDEGPTKAYLWDRGQLIDLGSLFGRDTWPMSVNNRGQAVGYSATNSWQDHPFLWKRGYLFDLGVHEADCDGTASLIGNDGVVYGSVYCSGWTYQLAVAWYPQQKH